MKTLKDFNELVFLVLIASAASMILKTMIFVNSLNKKIILVIHLCNLLFVYI